MQNAGRAEIERVDAASRRIAAVAADLAGLRARAGALAAQTDWQSSAAEAFRASVADWSTAIWLLDWPLERLQQGLRRTRAMLESLSPPSS
ncbi:hypothetical protein NQ166_10620 [Microbacterium sp. zg.Y1090]|uniref:hypothetical protein n=1 Tax=Microbacterium TaxID=33882 RepID=UPI00214CD684|nr:MULTISPECIES: hypothetical protein [unclassified Microbacterium]MCR2814004.1 hypothetical protein [Microbacterium sp. zg.Y1084]MCR2819278.1 hypothetical protein [Microbacterium sp. zg.Y1090]MDL5487195.1 hypothetical protein [Microbacterium sp. zg-Y1211]WIM28260.1 hypothetical protein QNO26_14120 [Microbacterium sp. zg-Y1090]